MVGFKVEDYEDEFGEAWRVVARQKFPSGTTGIIEFDPVDVLSDGTVCYNVVLDLRRKRKKASEYLAMTGRDGLEPAAWCLEVLREFEERFHEFQDADTARIEVFGDDNRRWEIYKRVLTKRGYHVTVVDKIRMLVKRLEYKGE